MSSSTIIIIKSGRCKLGAQYVENITGKYATKNVKNYFLVSYDWSAGNRYLDLDRRQSSRVHLKVFRSAITQKLQKHEKHALKKLYKTKRAERSALIREKSKWKSEKKETSNFTIFKEQKTGKGVP